MAANFIYDESMRFIKSLNILPVLAILIFVQSCEKPEEQAMNILEKENFKFTPVDFLRAASIGDNDILKNYLEAGMDIDTRGPDEDTALLVAAERGHLRTVEFLIQAGAEVNARSKDGWTPLMIAAFNNQPEIVTLLLANGGDPDKKDNSGWTALMQAVFKGHTRVVEAIIAASNSGADRALLVASLMGHSDVVRVLLDGGANINARTEENDTPLMLSAQKGRLETVEILLAAGADVALTNNVGAIAKDMAEERGHKEISALIDEAKIIRDRNELAARDDTEATLVGTEYPVEGKTPAATEDTGTVATTEAGDPATETQPKSVTGTETVDVEASGSVSGADLILTEGEPALPAPRALPAPSEEAWFTEHELDINDPEMYIADPDGDGFTNREEYLSDTDPKDLQSRPLYITKAVMVDYVASELPYILESVSGNAASVRNTDTDQIITVREGDSLGGLSVERVRKRVISSKESQQADVSDLTLQDSSGRSTLLIKGKKGHSIDSYAVIEVPGAGSPVNVREGEEFSLPGEGNVTYRVFEVRPTQVIVRKTDGNSTFTVKLPES